MCSNIRKRETKSIFIIFIFILLSRDQNISLSRFLQIYDLFILLSLNYPWISRGWAILNLKINLITRVEIFDQSCLRPPQNIYRYQSRKSWKFAKRYTLYAISISIDLSRNIRRRICYPTKSPAKIELNPWNPSLFFPLNLATLSTPSQYRLPNLPRRTVTLDFQLVGRFLDTTPTN